MSSMFDDEDEFDKYDEGEAFTNTLVHVGQGLIDHLFRYRAAHWPAMPDRDFLPVLDTVRTAVGELLGPEQLSELWDWACWQYTEQCREQDPKAKAKQCDAVLQSCLPEWHRIVSEAKPRKQVKTRRGNKRNCR